MKKIITKLSAIFAVVLIATACGTTFVQANYQSTKNVNRITQNVGDWRKNVRYMEKYGGVMGLNETIDDDTLVSQTSNSIDVHMMKNTEYGAMAILAVSTEYGKQPKATDTDRLKTTRYIIEGSAGLRTSTGNVYGVYIDQPYQYTSAFGTNNGTVDNYSTASRYYDVYKVGDGSQIEYKAGDALEETRGWQSTYNTWGRYLPNYGTYWVYRITDVNRAYYGGIMQASYGDNGYSRACIVNGDQI